MSQFDCSKTICNRIVRTSTTKKRTSMQLEDDLRELEKLFGTATKNLKTLFTSPKLSTRQEKRVNS